MERVKIWNIDIKIMTSNGTLDKTKSTTCDI